MPFARVLMNSALVAGATTMLCLAVASTAAFALAKLELRGKRALLSAALAVSMFPPIATVSPLYLALRDVRLLDTPLGIVIPHTTFALPLALWVLTGFFREIPDELYRAARVDGCSPFQAFRKVMLPLAMPGFATTGILVFIFSWNEFLYALTFTSSPEHRTVPVAISLFAGEFTEPWGEIAAASVIATLPLVIFDPRVPAADRRGAHAGRRERMMTWRRSPSRSSRKSFGRGAEIVKGDRSRRSRTASSSRSSVRRAAASRRSST